MSDSFDHLCDNARQRRPSALAGLVDRYQSLARNTIRRYMGRQLRRRVESADMLNDFWLSVLRGVDRLPALHESRNLKAYFRRIAFRQVTKQQRRHLTAGCRDVNRELAGVDLTQHVASQPRIPDAVMEREMLARLKTRATPQEWFILQQKMDGWSNREIARSQGVDEKTVRRTLRRLAAAIVED